MHPKLSCLNSSRVQIVSLVTDDASDDGLAKDVMSFSFSILKSNLTHLLFPPYSVCVRSVDDIDLFSAGLAEYPLPGAAVGPTFTCIIGIQMYNLKYGDRFWFEHKDQVASFSPGKLVELL